jgi:hypothetical protein
LLVTKKHVSVNTDYDNKTVKELLTIRFLGLQIDNNLNWEKHNKYIIPKIILACPVMRKIKPLLKTDALKLVYFALFHSMLSYGVIFWEN